MSPEERWLDVKARSLDANNCYCAPCYFSFFHGLQHPEGGGWPCPKHATEDEKREVGVKLNEALAGLDLADHPLMKMRRSRPVTDHGDPLRHVSIEPNRSR